MTQHGWSKESLLKKAQLYIEQMESHPIDDWRFGFWSSLATELLARAALANISPVLLADQNWKDLVHALGIDHSFPKFSPRTAPIRSVFDRLEELIGEFNQEVNSFCRQHIARRNVELHTGELAFECISASNWLPQFYEACEVLLRSMDKKLEDLLSDPAQARKMIEDFKSSVASKVEDSIKSHKYVWSQKSEKDQKKSSKQAEIWATKQYGHRVECPSCKSQALLQGTPMGEAKKEINGDEVVERMTMLPSLFECIACELKISGISKLSASGLGNTYTSKQTYTAAEYFDLYTEDDLERVREEMFEPDFNEY